LLTKSTPSQGEPGITILKGSRTRDRSTIGRPKVVAM
jgi:hypothetical protein